MNDTKSAASMLRGLAVSGGTGNEGEVASHTGSAKIPMPYYFGRGGAEPGRFPYERGIDAKGYHDKLWVMGQYSGYSSPGETNKRFKRLLQAGQTGLSIALDLPTQIGVDSDDPLAKGEVGKVGVPINSVEDILTLLDELPVEQIQQIRTTANAIAPIFAAFMIVALRELGKQPDSFRLLLQNDPLKEYTSRGTWIFPPEKGLKLAVDTIEYFAQHNREWQPIQFCGYHIRDAGGSVIQEVAISVANGIAYLDEAQARGVNIAAIAPTLFLFLSSGVEIFEEVAKFRATRRLWARILTSRYGVPEEKAAIKIFSYTLGGALTAQEPMNNIARVTCEALGAVLGGVQTLATSSWDEAHSLPSDDAVHISLRTQQIIAHESGVAKVADPLGGSFLIEALTDRLESEIVEYAASILDRGGAVACIESGFLSEEISRAAFETQKDIETGRKILVGVNFNPLKGVVAEGSGFTMDDSITNQTLADLKQMRAGRDAPKVSEALERIAADARNDENLMPAFIEAASARATIGEITAVLKREYGQNNPLTQTM